MVGAPAPKLPPIPKDVRGLEKQKEKGRVDGIVYGGNSRKVRNYLQISNKLFVSHSSKSENKINLQYST